MPTGPRRVNELRRVTIPRVLADRAGIKQDSFVSISGARSDQTVIEIRPARAPRNTLGKRDPRRVRKVPQSRQVTVPAVVLEAAGLDIGSVVAFRTAGNCVQLFDATRVVDPVAALATTEGPR